MCDTPKNPYPWSQVQVSMGMGTGFSEIPRGYLWHSLLTTVTDNLQLSATFPPFVARNASGGVPLLPTTPSVARNANGGPLSACHPLHCSKHEQRGPSACCHPLHHSKRKWRGPSACCHPLHCLKCKRRAPLCLPPPPSLEMQAEGSLPAATPPLLETWAEWSLCLPPPSLRCSKCEWRALSACHPLYHLKCDCHHPLQPLKHHPHRSKTTCTPGRWVQVLTGMGMGTGQIFLPKGYPCHSLDMVSVPPVPPVPPLCPIPSTMGGFLVCRLSVPLCTCSKYLVLQILNIYVLYKNEWKTSP